jgi:hypothetical protein
VDRSKFKNINGTYLLRGLFYEETGADKSSVVYTLKQEDHMGFPSFYRLYMNIADPTEYRVGTELLWGYHHWEILSECTWFKPFLLVWRRELATKIRAESLNNIKQLADPSKPTAFQANKYLLDGNWGTETGKPGRGRPSKDEVKRVAVELAEIDRITKEDLQRIVKN